MNGKDKEAIGSLHQASIERANEAPVSAWPEFPAYPVPGDDPPPIPKEDK
jgi:hypothetical protein